MTSMRTQTCGELRDSHIGQSVTLTGWVNTYRAYNDQVFVDLRDRYGLTQVVFEADQKELFAAAQQVRSEWVLLVRGKVRQRMVGGTVKTNTKLATGAVEVLAEELVVLNRCPSSGQDGGLPFEVNYIPNEGQTFSDAELANEDLRLQYRYLDLRRPTLQRTLAKRHQLCKVIRDYMDERGFLEVETPLLGKSTPEGARDYLVPSRVFPGQWFALPQSPQLYKQLLMVAGYDKYFQIARCLRDEDLRADRQPEFTQLDVEMSFVEMDDVFAVIEGLLAAVFKKCLNIEIPLPLPRLPYDEAMQKYGSDKPDLRIQGMEITDVSDLAGQSDFTVFKEVLAAGGCVRSINVKGGATKFSNTELKPGGKLPAVVTGFGAKGLAWMKVEADKFTSSIEKFFPAPLQQQMRTKLNATAGDLLLFVADKEDVVSQCLGHLRAHIAVAAGLADLSPGKFATPTWIVDFPSFMWDAEEKRWVANHHPFTSPRNEHLDILRNATEEDMVNPNSPLAKVKAKAYDLVLNGYELGGGSIRIHNPEVQAQLFRVLGMSKEQAKQRFGFLLDALTYGAPPHGGIALGMDRFTMMLTGTTNIRDVIAFPKNQKARDLMTGAPAPAAPRQLKELGL